MVVVNLGQKLNLMKKGSKLTLAHKLKISLANKGVIPYIMTEKVRKNMSVAQKRRGTIPPNQSGFHHSLETRQKMSLFWKTYKRDKKQYQKMAKTISGANHWKWKGGITKDRKKDYFSEKYQNWRKVIFERDNYVCQICKKTGGKLNVDHIKPYSLYPELRYELSNGRTLCIPCHQTTETFGGKLANWEK